MHVDPSPPLLPEQDCGLRTLSEKKAPGPFQGVQSSVANEGHYDYYPPLHRGCGPRVIAKFCMSCNPGDLKLGGQAAVLATVVHLEIDLKGHDSPADGGGWPCE